MTAKQIYKVSQRLNNGLRAWYFVKVHAGKEKKLKALIQSNINFDIADFGDVLCSGYGYPSQLTEKQYNKA